MDIFTLYKTKTSITRGIYIESYQKKIIILIIIMWYQIWLEKHLSGV